MVKVDDVNGEIGCFQFVQINDLRQLITEVNDPLVSEKKVANVDDGRYFFGKAGVLDFFAFERDGFVDL